MSTVYINIPHKTDEEPEEMTTEERSEFAEKCKNIGNRGFQVQDLVCPWMYEGLVTSVDKVWMKKEMSWIWRSKHEAFSLYTSNI